MRSISHNFHRDGIRANAICSGMVRTNLVEDAIWDAFPSHRLIPMSDVLHVIEALLDGGENGQGIQDGSGSYVSAANLYGLAVEVSNSGFYFRDQLSYCDDGMKEVMTFGLA